MGTKTFGEQHQQKGTMREFSSVIGQKGFRIYVPTNPIKMDVYVVYFDFWKEANYNSAQIRALHLLIFVTLTFNTSCIEIQHQTNFRSTPS